MLNHNCKGAQTLIIILYDWIEKLTLKGMIHFYGHISHSRCGEKLQTLGFMTLKMKI